MWERDHSVWGACALRTAASEGFCVPVAGARASCDHTLNAVSCGRASLWRHGPVGVPARSRQLFTCVLCSSHSGRHLHRSCSLVVPPDPRLRMAHPRVDALCCQGWARRGCLTGPRVCSKSGSLGLLSVLCFQRLISWCTKNPISH